MATRLYPPAIAGTLPAFCGTDTLSVPFSMNRAVGASEVAGFSLKIKTVSGVAVDILRYPADPDVKLSKEQAQDIADNMSVDFDISNVEFSIGQHYKIQLAYIDTNNVVGIYSTVGVIKYTSAPDVYIENLRFGHINQHNYSYVGVYSQAPYYVDGKVKYNRDTTEKLYSSYFKVMDENNNVIVQTEEKLHKSFEDTVSYESTEEVVVAQDLDVNRSYYIQFFTKSTGGMEIPSQKYRIMQRRSISPDIDVNLVATLDYDNGFIGLKLDTKEPVVSGLFLVSRAASNNGYKWEEFKRFDLQSMLPEKWSLMDCTIEQGVTYKYSLQQYNDNGIYSDRIVSNVVFADFEDAFLYDGEKQLKLKFNPKVSSFKTNVLESKIDTIGASHPYILRNGNIYYKDFPISGLISYHMDDTELFIPKTELGITETTTNLTSNNIVAERLFKTKVLEWLTNGKPKLFRSPAEGNFIVRLMNTSMSPNDTLGRMLHTFSSTAYEIAKFTMENLEYYGLIDARENISVQTRWATIDLLSYYKENSFNLGAQEYCQLNTRDAYRVEFRDMAPGTVFLLDGERIQMGATGAYIVDSVNDAPFKKIEIAISNMAQGQVTYSYKAKATNIFGTIDKIEIEDVPCWQWIGMYPTKPLDRYRNTITAVAEYNKEHPGEIGTDDVSLYQVRSWGLGNLLNEIEDCKVEILHIPFARFTKRPMIDVFIANQKEQVAYKKATGYLKGMTERTLYRDGTFDKTTLKLYADGDCTKEIPYSELDPYCLYNIRFGRMDYQYLVREGYVLDRKEAFLSPDTGFYYDPKSDTMSLIEDDLYTVHIGPDTFSVKENEEITVKNVSDYARDIRINAGVIAELSFSKQIAVYIFESKSPVADDLESYNQWMTTFQDTRKNTSLDTGVYYNTLEQARGQVKAWYSKYINTLDDTITDYKEANGIV